MNVYTEEHGEVVGASSPTMLVPEPELITRTDALADGKWTVFSAPASTSSAYAVIDHRMMSVPTSDDEVSRHIQAHELTHAKISPSEKQMEKVWNKRGYASLSAMIACEELRVHSYLTHKGFDTTQYIQNGTGNFIGTRVTSLKEAVLNGIRFARTAEYNPYMNALSRTNKDFVEKVSAIVSGAQKMFDSVLNSDDAFVRNGYTRTGSTPAHHGFRYTEACANWVEEMCGAQSDTMTKNPNQFSEYENASRTQNGGQKSARQAIEESVEEKLSEMEAGVSSTNNKGLEDLWMKLNISTPMLTRNAIGSIGKKRTASQYGKNPRRISRLYSDPQMRIFDRVTRGEGGVVLIDASGSMSLCESQVQQMLQSAPSATVATYSAGRSNQSNLWVIGRKGKMVDTIPNPHGGNGVDGPALEWAVKQRKNSKEPIIWVSDGGVTGKSDMFFDELVMQCIAICKKHGIYVVPTAEHAVAMLKAMSRGEKVTSNIPYQLGSTYRNRTGMELVLK